MFKSTFGISKKKLIENYEGQLKERDVRNKLLRDENRELKQKLKDKSNEYLENIKSVENERDYYKKSLEQTLIEREQLNKDNIEFNKKINKLEKDKEEFREEMIKFHDLYFKESHEVHKVNRANEKLISENKALKESKAILDEMTDELIKEVDKLVNKKINRLEALKKRTKRLRIKKKCEARILELEKRYLN